VTTVSDPIIDLTQTACLQVAELMDEEENPDLLLRVFITGGGCSGFKYSFTFADDAQADDLQLGFALKDAGDLPEKVHLLVDPLSLQYLKGATIDFKEDNSGARFVISNPNAKTTCGCGDSFGV
jgi:iron-sulfur cluster insertion protein